MQSAGNMKKLNLTFFYLSLLVGLFLWLLDAILDCFFYEGNFIQTLILGIPRQELFIRISVLFVLGVFGLIVSHYYTKSKLLSQMNKRNQERLSRMLNLSPMGVITLNFNGNFEFFNKAFINTTGYQLSDLETINDWFELLYPDTQRRKAVRKLWENDINQVRLGKKEIITSVQPINCKDGSVVYASISASIVEEQIVLSFLDITEIKEAALKVEQQQKQLRQIINLVPHFIYVVDADGIYKLVNKAVADFVGLTVEELEGSKSCEEPVSDEDVKRFRSTNEEILSGNCSKLEYFETLTHKDNKLFNFKTLKVPFDVEDESKKYVLGVSVNITDLKEAKKSEKDLHNVLENIVHNSSNMFYQHDTNFNLTYVSPQIKNLLGYEVEYALNNGTKCTTDNPINEEAIIHTKKAIETGIAQPYFEMELIHKDGNIVWVEVRETPLIKDGKVIAIVGALIDITAKKRHELQQKTYQEDLQKQIIERTKTLEEKTNSLKESQVALTYLLEDVNEAQSELVKANEELVAMNEELESFSYTISHDLRSPLRAINGFTKILSEEYCNSFDEEGKRLMSIVCNNVTMMSDLINDLLNYSKLGRKMIQNRVIDMNQVVEVELDLATKISENDKLKLIKHKLPQAKGDIVLIKQVWQNLISNAIKYSSKVEFPIIEIGSFIKDEHVVYFIKDNGVGFDMKYHHKIFGVFERLHSLLEFEGTGVGLAIAYRIIQKHNGKIWAESELNKATTFYFYIN